LIRGSEDWAENHEFHPLGYIRPNLDSAILAA
jgi:hypothetical protein